MHTEDFSGVSGLWDGGREAWVSQERVHQKSAKLARGWLGVYWVNSLGAGLQETCVTFWMPIICGPSLLCWRKFQPSESCGSLRTVFPRFLCSYLRDTGETQAPPTRLTEVRLHSGDESNLRREVLPRSPSLPFSFWQR